MTEEESQKILEPLAIGWYKTVHDNETIIGDFNYLLGQIAIIYGQFPANEGNDIGGPVVPRISLNWPSTPSEDAYLYFVLHLIPLQHLIQIRNPYEESVYRIIMAIFHPDSTHLSSWLVKSDKETLSPIANACITLIKNQKLTKSEEKTRLKKWDDLRTQFIYSLAPISADIPPFVFLMTLNFAFASHNREGNKDRVIADTCGINPMALAREITVAGEMAGGGGAVVGGDGASIMTAGEDAAVGGDDDVAGGV